MAPGEGYDHMDIHIVASEIIAEHSATDDSSHLYTPYVCFYAVHHKLSRVPSGGGFLLGTFREKHFTEIGASKQDMSAIESDMK